MEGFQFYLSVFKDIIVSLASLTAMTIAILGFSKWKKEMRGKVLYDFSRSFLKTLYNSRDTLNDIRSAMILSHEFMPDYPITPKLVSPEKEKENNYYIFGNRTKKLNEAHIQI